MRFVFVMASLLLACSTESSRDARVLEMHARGGSRLRPVVWESDDGLQLPIAIHDLRLGVRCEPELASDGALRCLPPAQHVQPASSLFADAKCTRAVTWIDRGFHHVPGYLREALDRNSCTPRKRVFRARTVEEVYSNFSGECVRDPGMSGEEAVEEIPASELVRLAPHGGLRIRSDSYEGEDGSRITFGTNPLFDTTFGVPCEPGLTQDGRERCIPYPSLAPVGFSDATCSAPALGAWRCIERPLVRMGESLTESVRVYDAGEPLTAIFDRRESTCEAKALPRRAFRLGREIDPANFVAVKHTTFGGARLHANALELDNRLYPVMRAFYDARLFHDTQLGEECALAEVSKDTYRCLPVAASGYVVYLDEKCTQPAAQVWADGTLPRWAYLTDRDYYFTAAYTVPPSTPRDAEIYDRIGSSCSLHGRGPVVPVGFLVPLSSFPEVREVIR